MPACLSILQGNAMRAENLLAELSETMVFSHNIPLFFVFRTGPEFNMACWNMCSEMRLNQMRQI